jgi:hypothetical protein
MPLVDERILVMDCATSQAQREGVGSTLRHLRGPAEATMAKAKSLSPPPTIDEVDRLYHQLGEIHTIGAMQLVECARWWRSTPAPSSVWARTGQQGPDAMLSMIRMVPLPPTDFSPPLSLATAARPT